MRTVKIVNLVLAFSGCITMSVISTAYSGSMPQDGELKFPSNYQSFPTFLKGVQKPDAVRDLFINKIGTQALQGEQFPNGTIFVMEIYHAQKGADGKVTKDANGNLLRGDLAKIYVMQKGEGWGKRAPEGLKNGDYIYSAFQPNGDRLDVDYTKCRSCHMPLGDAKDYIHRYDEYFEKRGHRH